MNGHIKLGESWCNWSVAKTKPDEVGFKSKAIDPAKQSSEDHFSLTLW